MAVKDPTLANFEVPLWGRTVCAKLAEQSQDWWWSSVAPHLSGEDDKLVKDAPVREPYGGFAAILDPGTGNGRQEPWASRDNGAATGQRKMDGRVRKKDRHRTGFREPPRGRLHRVKAFPPLPPAQH